MARPSLSILALVGLATLGCGLVDGPLLERPLDLDHTVMVIVAARDLYPATTVTEEDLYALEIPAQLLPDGVFLSPEHVVGRRVRQRILANEFVQAQRFADPETGWGLKDIIPVGMRAVALPGGKVPIAPGDYVDLWTTKGTACAVSQATFVLDVNGVGYGAERAPASRITVLVRPEQMGPLLATADALRITVRSENDVTENPEVQCTP